MIINRKALFLAGPGVPHRFRREIVAEAAFFCQECEEEGLYAYTDFPDRGLPAEWYGLKPIAFIGERLKDDFCSEFAYHTALLEHAEKVYLFASARSHRQREWVNDFCDCAFAVETRLYLHLF